MIERLRIDPLIPFFRLGRDLIESKRMHLAGILSLEVIGTVGIGGCLGAIISLLKAPQEDSIVRFWSVALAIPPHLRIHLVLASALFGIFFTFVVYLAHRMCISIAVERANEIFESLILTMADPEKQGWQGALTLPFWKSLRTTLTSGMRALAISLVKILRSIYPMLLVFGAILAIFYLWVGGTLLLLLLLALYATLAWKMGSRIVRVRKENEIFNQERKKGIKSLLRHLNDLYVNQASENDKAQLREVVKSNRIDRKLLDKQELEGRSKNLNGGVFLAALGALLVYWWQVGRYAGISLGNLLIYLVAMHVLFRSLNQLATSIFFLSRFFHLIKPVLDILQFANTNWVKSKVRKNAALPSQLSLLIDNNELSGANTGKIQKVALSRGESVAILVDEPVNRLSLPSVVFLAERLFSLEPFSLFGTSIMMCDPECSDQELSNADAVFVGLSIIKEISCIERLSRLPNWNGWIFLVAEGLDFLIKLEAKLHISPDTKCLVISDGMLNGFYRLEELLKSDIPSKRHIKKVPKDYPDEDDDFVS